MKKILFVLCLLLIFIAACNSNKPEDNTNETEETTNQEAGKGNGEEGTIEVDKNLLSIEVTLPASFLELNEEALDVKGLKEQAKEQGIKDIKQNDDGSLTYKMTKSAHKLMMKEMKDNLTESINEVVDSDDYPSINEIKSNKNFNEFDVIVNREQFENSFDGFAVLGIAFGSMFYQIFEGVDPDNCEAAFNFIDKNTGEEFSTVSYPDAFEE